MSEKKVSYSNQEKVFWINLIEKYKSVIENKKTDSTNLQEKQKVWEKITEIYNSNFLKRNAKQLKKIWDNLKQKTRKSDSELKYKLLQTGGGPPPEEDNNPINEMVRAIVPTINFKIENMFDSDGQIIKSLQKENSDFDNNTERYYSNFCENDIVDENYNQKSERALENTPKTLAKTPLTSKEERDNTDTLMEKSSLPKTNIFIKNKRESSVSGRKHKLDATTTYNLHEESSLRIKKLKISIEQQEELHNVKMDVARAEKNYWEQRLNLLLNQEIE